jgi:hypothetical protein
MHAALPVVIVPLLEWFDQPGWGGCAHALGVGTVVRRDPTAEGGAPSRDAIERALRNATSSAAQARAAAVSRALRTESGVDVALDALENSLAKRVRDRAAARGATAASLLTEESARMVRRDCLVYQRARELGGAQCHVGR